MDLEKLLTDIERYKRDRKKFTIELEHASDACIDAINSVFNTKPVEEIDAFLDIVYEGVRADQEQKVFERDMKKVDPKKFYSFSNMEMFVEAVPRFLGVLNGKDEKDAYLAVVFSAEDDQTRQILTHSALPYLNILRRKRYRNAYIEVLRRLHKILPAERTVYLVNNVGGTDTFWTYAEIDALEYLDALTDSNCRESYFEILLRVPEDQRCILAETLLPNLGEIAEYKGKLTELLDRLGGPPRRAILLNPLLVKQIKGDNDRETYLRVSDKMTSMTDQTLGTDALSWSIVHHISELSEEDNASKFLRFAEKLQQRYRGVWPFFAAAVLPHIALLDEASELPFIMIEEGEMLVTRFGTDMDIIKGMLNTAVANQDVLGDEHNRRIYLSAVARVAECEQSSRQKWFARYLALNCHRFLDLLENPRGMNDLVTVIRKARRMHARAAEPTPYGRFEEVVVRAAPVYIEALKDKDKRRTFFDVAFRSGRKISEPYIWASFMESVATRPEVLTDIRNRRLYMQLVYALGQGSTGNHCRAMLDNLEALADEKKRAAYIELMKQLSMTDRTQAIAEALIPRLGFFADAKKLEYFQKFLGDVPKMAIRGKQTQVISGALPYVEALEADSLGRYLDKICSSLHNAPHDIERWVGVGLECIKKYGSSAERYFDYKFKEGSLECKIDELAAIELMLHGEVKYPNRQFHMKLIIDYSGNKGRKAAERRGHIVTQGLFVREGGEYLEIGGDGHSLRYYPVRFHPANRERKAVEKTRRLVGFVHKLNNLRHVQDSERKESQRRNLKSAFPALARFVDALADGERPLLKAPPQTFLEKGAYQAAQAYEKSRNVEYEGLQGESALRSLERRVQEYVNGETGGKYLNINEFLVSLLTVQSSKKLVEEIRDHPDIAGKEHEGFRHYLSSLINNLTPMALFDRIRIEENACFLDDLVDRTGSCISTDGSEREATLIYKVGGRDKKRKSTEILELNAYHGDKFVTSLGKILLVHVKDKGDGNKAKLLVEGVIVGPDLRFIFDACDDRWPWEFFVYEGILKYAEEQDLKNVVFNAEHSGGQQCTHDFVRYAAGRVNAHNEENRRPQRVEYDCAEVDGASVFRLGGVAKSIDGFEYTHQLTRVEPRRRDVEKIRRGSWDGECYFDSWYAWHGENVWNNGTGYIRGFELDLRPQPMRIPVPHEVFKYLKRTKGPLSGGKGANLASLVGRYEKRRGSGKRGQRR